MTQNADYGRLLSFVRCVAALPLEADGWHGIASPEASLWQAIAEAQVLIAQIDSSGAT